MKKYLLVIVLIIAFTLTSCSSDSVKTEQSGTETKTSTVETDAPGSGLKIVRYPTPDDFRRGKLASLPEYDPDSKEGWQVDLRGYDLTSLDLSSRMDDLIYADFDSKTKWPEKLPKGFEPEKIMEIGRNPGLGLRELHKTGITGKGVGIAILDQPLLIDHEEYKDNLKMYEEIHWPAQAGTQAQMHGPAVASIAVGKTVGVAPDADLYYIAQQDGDYKGGEFTYDFTWLAQSIDRILEVNKTLPNDRKIRVISASIGWDKSQKGYEEVTAAVDRAKKDGVFVVSSSLVNTHGYFFNGLGRDPLKDPENALTYKAGIFWDNPSYGDKINDIKKQYNIEDILLVPMDSRTTASPTGSSDYVYYTQGGWSWSIPYIAGMYALACQADPDITPERFWEAALNTGTPLNVKMGNNEQYIGKVANPIKLIEEIKK